MSIAVVDFSQPSAKNLFVQSIRETGFAVVENHGISWDLIQKVFKSWENFFSQPEFIKRKFLFKRDFQKVQDGFFPQEISEVAKGEKVKDIKEFYHYYPCCEAPTEYVGEETGIIRSELISLAKTMLKILEEALPIHIKSHMSQSLSEMVDEEYQTLLRILHYPPLTHDRERSSIRAAAHEDINLITLLVSPSAAGLQALDKQGLWRDVPYGENCITVNIGDMVQECTEGYYQSTKHRVINLEDSAGCHSRYSMPLFLHAKDEVVLSQRYTAKEYRMERLQELGLV